MPFVSSGKTQLLAMLLYPLNSGAGPFSPLTQIITIKKRKFWGLKEAYFKTFP